MSQVHDILEDGARIVRPLEQLKCSSLSSPNVVRFIWVPPFGYAQKTGGSNTNLDATSKFCPHVSRLD